MCLAMATTKGAKLDKGMLFRGWTNNPHGAGFAYVNDRGVLTIRKGFMKYNDFEAALNEAYGKFGQDSPFLIHMRYATRGTVNKSNTHPFAITPQSGPHGAYIHNGTMFDPAGNWKGTTQDMKSDSRVFGAVLNNILSLDVVKAAKEELERYLTSRNRIAFLYEDKSLVIINEGVGFWEKGVWYSNHSCTYTGRTK